MTDEPSAQDPRVGSYPMADEANKWGMWRDLFAQHRAEGRTIKDEQTRAFWCEPYFRTLIEEFLYVWQHDEKFVERYKPYGSTEDLYGGKQPTVGEMGMILSWLKDSLSQHRRLWGYDRLTQASPARKVLKLDKHRNGNGANRA